MEGRAQQPLRFAQLPVNYIEEKDMGKHTYGLHKAINTLILSSLLVSAHALAQDNHYAAQAQLTTSAAALQPTSGNDCYRNGRSARLMLRITDLSSLWHYATRVLMPSASSSASAAPGKETGVRNTEKGMVWRIGTESGGVLVSANMAW